MAFGGSAGDVWLGAEGNCVGSLDIVTKWSGGAPQDSPSHLGIIT